MSISSFSPFPSSLEERFRQPEGWRWHEFTRDGRKIRFGAISPKDSIPDAVVVCLPGLGEFGEKYFETARDCLNLNLAFWVIDWMGQGRSGRYLKNPHKRHSTGFQADVDDLHYFIMEYIKHSSVHPDKGRIPMAMLAHSMGANIGLHYLSQHPGIFECAAFTAPLFGVKKFAGLPGWVALAATGLMRALAGQAYLRQHGGGDWDPATRPAEGPEAMSSDPKRAGIHMKWLESDPALRIGNITYGWLHHALVSCLRIENREFLHPITTPCLIALAGNEPLVDNEKTRKIANALTKAEILNLPEARHEILMERDEIRNRFLEGFYGLIKENIINRPETLKPF